MDIVGLNMETRTVDTHADIDRRQWLVQGGSAFLGLTLLGCESEDVPFLIGDQGELIPWTDSPDTGAMSQVNLLDWENLDSWITPTSDLFRVGHYNRPVIQESEWNLVVDGLVKNPLLLTLDELRSRPKMEQVFTLECAGNRGFSSFIGAVHNAKWIGTSLASVLEEAGVMDDGIEVVFWGSDSGQEEIRGNSVTQNFARSMSIEDAMDPNVMLCYEVNDQPLPNEHGFPLRLIAPGWYGVANVKWLKKIELRDSRFMGKFMARDYVTLREEKVGGESVWMESSVGRTRINSVPAKVTFADGKYRVHGAAWGSVVSSVEVSVDGGDWRLAQISRPQESEYSWAFWHMDWDGGSPGEHTITSRATDVDGRVQPAPSDPSIALKKTYWESNGQLTRRIVTGDQ